MSRPFRLVLRFLTVVLILALASVALAPTSSPKGPYLSALADLAAGSAFAAPPGMTTRTHRALSIRKPQHLFGVWP